MKKQNIAELDVFTGTGLSRKSPELNQKLDDMKRVKEDMNRAVKENSIKEEKENEKKVLSSLRENIRQIIKYGVMPFSLKAKRAHLQGSRIVAMSFCEPRSCIGRLSS